MPGLYVEMGKGVERSGEVVKIGGARILAGRARRCQIVLHSDVASREHASIRLTGEGWIVEDLGSRNGTFLNGKRVARASLRPLDTLKFGETGPSVRVVSLDPPPSAASLVDDPKTQEAILVTPITAGSWLTPLRSALFFIAGAALGAILSLRLFGDRFPYLECTALSTWITRQIGRLDVPALALNLHWIHRGLTAVWFAVLFYALSRPHRRWPILALLVAAHAGAFFLVRAS